MATNFGTKVAINAYKCMSTRHSENVITYNRGFVVENAITYNRGFLWSTNAKKTFLIARV